MKKNSFRGKTSRGSVKCTKYQLKRLQYEVSGNNM